MRYLLPLCFLIFTSSLSAQSNEKHVLGFSLGFPTYRTELEKHIPVNILRNAEIESAMFSYNVHYYYRIKKGLEAGIIYSYASPTYSYVFENKVDGTMNSFLITLKYHHFKSKHLDFFSGIATGISNYELQFHDHFSSYEDIKTSTYCWQATPIGFEFHNNTQLRGYVALGYGHLGVFHFGWLWRI
jgi:hypothetical protein